MSRSKTKAQNPDRQLRKICLSFPDAYEEETWEIPTFRIRKKIFCMRVDHDDRPAIWYKAPEGVQRILMESDPERFFRPPYLGPKGWVGMHLDKSPDWDEAAFMLRRSFMLVAPKRISAKLPPLESDEPC